MVTFASLSPHWSAPITTQLVIGRPAYFAVHAILIVIFTLLYTAYVLDPGEIADQIQRYGGTIQLIPPAEPTAAYLDQALSRTALFGAIYLTAICLPESVTIYARVPFHFGGLPLLITVCTSLDLETQCAVSCDLTMMRPGSPLQLRSIRLDPNVAFAIQRHKPRALTDMRRRG